MSTPSATVVTPSGDAAHATAMKGGAVALSPLPLSGGRKRRMTKKMKTMLKTLMKLKGGELEEAVEAAEDGADAPVEGARRRRRGSRKSRRGSRKGRAGLFY